MAEYIERDAAIANLTALEITNPSATMTDAKRLLADMHAVDFAPVVHGRWEPGNPICPVCGENKFKDLDADIWCDWQPDFCPNCGAKMDGGAE